MSFKYDKYDKRHRFVRKLLISVVSLIALIWVWWLVSEMSATTAFPSPMETWNALVQFYNEGYTYTGSFWETIGRSMNTFLKGVGLALIIALPLGLLLGYYALLNEFASPIIEVLKPIAPIAWAPILAIVFSSSATAGVLVVFIGIFFPLLTNISFGVKNIDSSIVDAARTLGASKFAVVYKVLLPAAIPYMLNGLKIGLGIGWMCIVAAEMYSSSGGLGYMVATAGSVGDAPMVMAAIIVIGLLGMCTVSASEQLNRIVGRWVGINHDK